MLSWTAPDLDDGSGTLHQAWDSLRLGRPLFLLDSVANNADLGWPAEMLAYGAEVLAEDTVEFFFESLPSRGRDEHAQLLL